MISIRIIALTLLLTGGAAHGVTFGEFEGDELVPNKWNLATGTKFTGEKCRITLREVDGAIMVASNFWQGEFPADSDAIRGRDFYLGDLGDGKVFVLQLWTNGRPVALTLTSHDDAGKLNYGKSGKGDFIRECTLPPRE